MDTMLIPRDNLNKNIKDISGNSLKDLEQKSLTSYGASTKNIPFNLAYIKINKLITALYMVTDTIDKDEPIRLKLRTLGVEILSDTPPLSRGVLDNLDDKIDMILSFLNIASQLRMISEMNYSILKKEFVTMKELIIEDVTKKHLWLEEFVNIKDEKDFSIGHKQTLNNPNNLSFNKGQTFSVRNTSTRIGVQKGSTLLKALGGIKDTSTSSQKLQILKNNRRESIIKAIKNKPDGMSIKDIIFTIRSNGGEIGEKTLQRELVSMVKDTVLKKNGEKRWSTYKLASSN